MVLRAYEGMRRVIYVQAIMCDMVTIQRDLGGHDSLPEQVSEGA